MTVMHLAEEERRVAGLLGLDSQALRLEHRHAREAQHVHAGVPVQLRGAAREFGTGQAPD